VRHAEVQSQLADYLEGDLPLTKRARIDAHFDICESCSNDLAELRQTISLVRGLPTPEPPADLVESVMARVRAGEGRVRLWDRISAKLGELSSPIFVVPAGAVAVALVTLVISGDLVGVFEPAQLVETEFAASLPAGPGGPADPARPPGEQVRPGAPGLASARTAVAGVERRARAQRPLGPLEPLPQRSFVATAPFSDPLFGVREWQLRDMLVTRAPFRGTSRAELIPVASGAGQRSNLVELMNVPAPLVSTRDPAERKQWRSYELDGRLAIALTDPVLFVQDLARHSLAERELWLRELADRALETGRVEAVEDSLRASGAPEAIAMADVFAEASKVLRAKVVAGGGESTAGSQDAAR
jgi:hypothetical protein